MQQLIIQRTSAKDINAVAMADDETHDHKYPKLQLNEQIHAFNKPKHVHEKYSRTLEEGLYEGLPKRAAKNASNRKITKKLLHL